jgi:hypothetical protein
MGNGAGRTRTQDEGKRNHEAFPTVGGHLAKESLKEQNKSSNTGWVGRLEDSISTTKALQHPCFQQRTHRTGPMAVELLLHGRHLSECLSGPGDQEDGVVAEARLPTPFRNDLASTLALEELCVLSWSGQGQHAHKAPLPWLWLAFEPSQQLCGALLLRGPEAG